MIVSRNRKRIVGDAPDPRRDESADLRAGAMIEGVVVPSEKGTPQGGPLSPLLANIYLHALDQELEQRGLAFCRYADDCNLYGRSPRAAVA